MIKAITKSCWEVIKDGEKIGYVRLESTGVYTARRGGHDIDAAFETVETAAYALEQEIDRFSLLDLN